MQSDFRFNAAGEQTGLLVPASDVVNEAYLKGLYAGMHFSSVSRWNTPFLGGGGGGAPPPGYHSFSEIPVGNEGFMPYESLYGFSSQMEARPEMNFRKQDDRESYAGVFDLHKLIHSGGTISEIDDEIYPSDAGSVVDFISPPRISSLDESNQGFPDRFGTVLPLLESFDQHRLLKSQPQPPPTRLFSPPINLPLTEPPPPPSSSTTAKPQFTTKRLKTTPARSSWAETKAREGDRRRRISEKTRCLQNLIPGCEKSDIATMLQEAYKYIKFLQAQFLALHSMPIHDDSGSSASPPPPDYGGCCLGSVYGKLGKLNRQQLLQLMVNSPMLQTALYTRGCCIYSVDQLNYLNRV